MILHVDMDYFFAQIEEKRHPEYEGKIIAVCVYSGRTETSGIVSTTNYLGRKYGIHSGMPIQDAMKKVPPADSVFLPVDRKEYERISMTIDSIIRKYSNNVEKRSIDEWYLEIEDKIAEETANAIKNEIKKTMNFDCTVGGAPSWIGAKMATTSAKPNGLLLLDSFEENRMIDESTVSKIPGIGKKTSEMLTEIGVYKINDLRNVDPVQVIEIFGKKTGSWLVNLGKGNYESGLPAKQNEVQNEISHIGTLKEKTREPYLITHKLFTLLGEPEEWMKKHAMNYKTITTIIITDDLKTHTKSLTFRKPKKPSESIRDELTTIILQFLAENNKEVYRIGIKFSNFVSMVGQTTLF